MEMHRQHFTLEVFLTVF